MKTEPPKWTMTEEENGHQWGRYKSAPFESCKICCFVRRADKESKPCRGRAPVILRVDQKGEEA